MSDVDQRAVLAASAHGKWLDRALAARRDLESVLARVLAEARGRDPTRR